MTNFATPRADSEAGFTDADFEKLANMAKKKFGLSLSPSKKPLVYSRLSRRLQVRNGCSFPQYLELLERPEEETERLELISALTTNVTSFFREEHHFDTLREVCLPDMLAHAQSGGRVRIWSAGCSSGQEPYSIAAAILMSQPGIGQYDVKILATDIDPKIVKRAEQAIYPAEEVASLPEKTRHAMFDHAEESATVVVKKQIRSLVTCAELNLIETWPFKGPFDVIFCRNVAIYFDQSTQQTIWSKFADYLKLGGHLFIGHSERVTGEAMKTLKPSGITTYQKLVQ